MTTQARTYNLSPELVKHFSDNIDYFSKLLFKDFKDVNVVVTPDDIKKIEKSFDASHRIRELEIRLYWQRLNYLWAITALLFAGWGALIVKILEMQSEHIPYSIYFALSLISFTGCIVTIFTSFIISAGNHWQKVWEYHISALEPFVSGGLYAIEFKSSNPKNVKASISKTVEGFNVSLLILWVVTTVIAAIMPSQISNSMAGCIQFVITVLFIIIFIGIRSYITDKRTNDIQLV